MLRSPHTDRFIAIGLYLLAIFLMTFISVWHINSIENQVEKIMGSRATQMAEHLSALLSIPGWDLDETLARPVVFAAMKSSEVYAVKIFDQDGLLEGQRRNQDGELEPWNGEFLSKTVQAISPIMSDGKRIGAVEVYLGFDENLGEIDQIQGREFIGNIIALIFINICLGLYLWQNGDLKIAYAYLKDYWQKSRQHQPLSAEHEDHLASYIDQAQKQQIVDPEAARQFITTNDSAIYVAGQFFGQIFQDLPSIMTLLVAKKDFQSLAQLAHKLSLSAPTIGAHRLTQSAKALEEALKVKEDCEVATANCIQDLKQVLNLLKNQATPSH